MNASWKSGMKLALSVALCVGIVVVLVAAVTPSHSRYSVVLSEGHNLIVTDNQTDTLYFYTTDKDKPIGSELHLRGSMDLKSVGKPEIKPTHHKK